MLFRKNTVENTIKSYKIELNKLKEEEESFKDYQICKKIENGISYYKNISDSYRNSCNELSFEIERLKNKIFTNLK